MVMDRSVLIVDDEQHVRRLITQTLEDLEDEGVVLSTAADGQEALRMIEETSPLLVLLDVMMPKMNGFDVCRTIKNDLERDDIYVILLTAKGQEFDRQHGLEVGADMYMTKPFDPDQLLEKAMEILGLRTGR
jgi:two-component system, OmpR family, alkaline phosphatase synthesis response regulator PhoP